MALQEGNTSIIVKQGHIALNYEKSVLLKVVFDVVNLVLHLCSTQTKFRHKQLHSLFSNNSSRNRYLEHDLLRVTRIELPTQLHMVNKIDALIGPE
jgi:hypothetical protein